MQRVIESWILDHEEELACLGREGCHLTPNLKDSLNETMNSGTGASVMAAEIPTVLGRTAGGLLGRHPTLDMLFAAKCIMDSNADWDAFSDAIAQEAEGAGLRRFQNLLIGLVDAFTWAPRRIVLLFRENACVYVEHYRTAPRISDVWSDLHSRIMMRHSPAFDALRRCDPGAYLLTLDLFPHPDPGRQILAYAAQRLDVAGLLNLLSIASPCFDKTVWRPEVKTPILLLQEITEKLMFLPADDDGGFKAAAAKAVELTTRRVDGEGLGFSWLQQLIQGNWNRARADPGPNVIRQRTMFLAMELASKLPYRSDQVRWIDEEHEVWRRDRAVAFVAVAMFGEKGGVRQAAEAARLSLQRGLLTTNQEMGIADAGNPERLLMTYVMMKACDPAGWFEELWAGFAQIRDKARHLEGYRKEASDTLAVAITWFLFGLCGVDVKSSAHRQLWRSLHTSIRECAITHALIVPPDFWDRRYAFLAALLATRLVAEPEDVAALDDLKDLLSPLMCLDPTLVKVLNALLHQNVAAATIATASGNAPLMVDLLRKLQTEEDSLNDLRGIRSVDGTGQLDIFAEAHEAMTPFGSN